MTAHEILSRKTHHVDVALVEQDDPPFCIEHAKAMHHVVERGVQLQLLLSDSFSASCCACDSVATP